jgi:predicted RNA binding protein YcfA (HicA-like mRNA interferase family)
MKLPRDVGANQLIKALRVLGYSIDHQRGSHIRIVTQLNGQHHETIPNHSPTKVGTLARILQNIAGHSQRHGRRSAVATGFVERFKTWREAGFQRIAAREGAAIPEFFSFVFSSLWIENTVPGRRGLFRRRLWAESIR